MLDDYYFKEKIDKMNRLKESIRFHRELVDKYTYELEKSDEENYDEVLSSIKVYESIVSESEMQLVVIEEEFNIICLFNTELSLSFLVRVLNDLSDDKYHLINTGNEYIIESASREEKYTFPLEDQMNLYEFLMSGGSFLENHSELKGIVVDLLNVQAKRMHCDGDNYKERTTFQIVFASIPANHPEVLRTEIKMHPGFKDVINELVGYIFTDDTYRAATKEDCKIIYRKIINGELNKLMDNPYWFCEKVSANRLTNIQHYADKYGVDINWTSENYAVLVKFMSILDRVNFLDKYGKCYIEVNGHTQTKASDDERKEIDEIAKEILTTDYNWRDARELVRDILRFSFSTDYEFPHNVEKIRQTMKVKSQTLFDKIDENIDLKSDLSNLQEEAMQLFVKLEALKDIKEIFKDQAKTPEESYLRRMILANWDVEKALKNKGISQEIRENIQNELIKGTKLSEESISILFEDNKGANEKSQKIIDIACGTLRPFTREKKIEDLFGLAKDIQFGFNLKFGVVGEMELNTHPLPDHDSLISISRKNIEPMFNKLQKQYEYLYDNASDAEFLEGAIEIYGDIIVMQAFREGNKRTAKSVFNAMLLSRGIIPPVNDLNEQEKRLFLDIACGRFERYMKAKYKLLLQTVDVKRQFKEKEFCEPLSLDDMEVDPLLKNV